MATDPKDDAGSDENFVTCPTCGKKAKIDEQKAQKDGYVLCPSGHKIELMQGLM
jgi:DNA-directed RNA polymerase subunit RPC12/RpoP